MFPPPPTLAYKDSRSSLRSQHHRSTSRLSVFRSAPKSIKSARSIRSKASVYEQDIELQSLPPTSTTAMGSGGGGEVQEGRPHPLGKQVFSADDESLPKTTRAVLKLLYWVFELAFWVLGVLVQILAAGIVGAGKLVKKL